MIKRYKRKKADLNEHPKGSISYHLKDAYMPENGYDIFLNKYDHNPREKWQYKNL